MQSLWLIIIVLFLILFIVPIFAKLYFSFNVLDNLGAISLYIFFIKIIAYKIKYESGQIVVFTSKHEKDIEIQVSNKQLRFLKQLSVQLKQKIILKKVIIYSRIGLNDAANSAILTGVFNSIVSCFVGYVKNIKKSAKFYVLNNPNYNGYNFTFSSTISCSITIFDVIYALIMAFVIIKRSEKYERV